MESPMYFTSSCNCSCDRGFYSNNTGNINHRTTPNHQAHWLQHSGLTTGSFCIHQSTIQPSFNTQQRIGFITANQNLSKANLLEGSILPLIKFRWKYNTTSDQTTAPFLRWCQLSLMWGEDTQCLSKPISQVPIPTPSSASPYTALIICSAHAKLFHAGVNNTLTVVRQVYWIPTGRQYIQVMFCHCITCKKHSEKPYKALDMVPLPKVRLQDTPSFIQ